MFSKSCSIALVFLTFSAARLSAQFVLLAEYEHAMQPVVAASGMDAVVIKNGERVVARTERLALKPVDDLAPLFVAVRDVQISSRVSNLVAESMTSELNETLYVKATFESNLALDDVFLVLQLEKKVGGKLLFLHEIGSLLAQDPKRLDLKIRVPEAVDVSRAESHVFVSGSEVFQSMQSVAFREKMLDQMVARQTKNQTERSPQPFYCPPPAYPAAGKDTGRVKLHFTILPNGAIHNPSVLSASDPMFGESALTAVREWRFLPRVKDGQPVITEVNLPIEIPPPDAAKTKRP